MTKKVIILETHNYNDCELGCGGSEDAFQVTIIDEDGTKREYGRQACATCFENEDVPLEEVMEEVCKGENLPVDKLPYSEELYDDGEPPVQCLELDDVLKFFKELGYDYTYLYEDTTIWQDSYEEDDDDEWGY